MTNREAYDFCRQQLRGIYPDSEADAVATRLFDEAYQLDKTKMIISAHQAFEHGKDMDTHIKRLLQSEPLQHVLGYEWFGGLKIRVNSSVLIPRPETEELLEWVIEKIDCKGKVIVDVCTGSGCMAMYMRSRCLDAKIIATDVSTAALTTAIESEQQNFKDCQIGWLEHDILKSEWLLDWPEVVVCNPPYISREEADLMTENVLAFEPHLALFVEDPDTLLFYKRVIEVFAKGPFPLVFFELNPLTAEALSDYCANHGFKMETGKDMQGKIRFALITR